MRPNRLISASFLLTALTASPLAACLFTTRSAQAQSAQQTEPRRPTAAEMSKKETVASAFLRGLQYQEYEVRSAAEAMPEEKYGFAPTTTYELFWEERRYPPKAVLGAAYELATGQRLGSGDFEGGKTGAVKVLKKLGFSIEKKLRPTGSS